MMSGGTLDESHTALNRKNETNTVSSIVSHYEDHSTYVDDY